MYQPTIHSLIWALSMYNKALSFVRTIGQHRQRHCRWKVFAFISTWYVDVFETNLFTHSFISISMRNFYIHVSHTRTHAGRTRLLVRVFAHTKHMQTNKQFHSELKCRWIEIELFHKPSLINQSHNKYFTHSLNRSLSFAFALFLRVHFDKTSYFRWIVSVCVCVRMYVHNACACELL